MALNKQENTREDIIRIAVCKYPKRNIIISTNLLYPLSTAKELGEVWILDADTDMILYSTPRANHVACRELLKGTSGLGMRPTESPLPRGFKDRMRKELIRKRKRLYWKSHIGLKQRNSILSSLDWFGKWLGV